MENKYSPSCPTIARIVGDAVEKTGSNGKPYRIVPIELIGGKKASAFCRGIPEMDSYVMVRVQHRESGFSYTVYDAPISSIQFLADAYAHWAYSLEK